MNNRTERFMHYVLNRKSRSLAQDIERLLNTIDNYKGKNLLTIWVQGQDLQKEIKNKLISRGEKRANITRFCNEIVRQKLEAIFKEAFDVDGEEPFEKGLARLRAEFSASDAEAYPAFKDYTLNLNALYRKLERDEDKILASGLERLLPLPIWFLVCKYIEDHRKEFLSFKLGVLKDSVEIVMKQPQISSKHFLKN